jgi:hypothetical protein
MTIKKAKKAKKLKLFIAYYYNGDNEKDAELYYGLTGSNKEFIKYWKMAYDIEMEEEDIDYIFHVTKEFGIDGKYHKVTLK